jgi:hypothetical protein
MPYDEALAARVRRAFGRRRVTEKRMFGGLAFMVRGHMCCGIVGDDLMVRVGPVEHGAALKERHVRPMDFTGRPLKGMVYVSPDGVRTDRAVAAWVERGCTFVRTLAPKA